MAHPMQHYGERKKFPMHEGVKELEADAHDPDAWENDPTPCEHRDEAFPNGHIEKHIYVGLGRRPDDIEWCPGAGT